MHVTHAVMMYTDGTHTKYEIFRSKVLYRRGTPYMNLNTSESVGEVWKYGERPSQYPKGIDGFYHDLAAPFATTDCPVVNWKELTRQKVFSY